MMSCDVRNRSSIVLDCCSPRTHFRSQPHCGNRSMSLVKDTPHLPATFNRSSPASLVRVRVSVAAGRFLAPRLPPLLADHPGLKVELVVGDRLDDMIDDGLDLAVHTGEITDASLVIRRVGLAARVMVAAPSYVEHSAPTLPADLADHIYLLQDTGRASDLWPLITPEGTESVRVSGRFITNDVAAAHLAVRAGSGLALLPLAVVFRRHSRRPPHTNSEQLSTFAHSSAMES
jgi:DNA-binding transcriptional LysR family regulator